MTSSFAGRPSTLRQPLSQREAPGSMGGDQNRRRSVSAQDDVHGGVEPVHLIVEPRADRPSLRDANLDQDVLRALAVAVGAEVRVIATVEDDPAVRIEVRVRRSVGD
jgi:hypothetical protein